MNLYIRMFHGPTDWGWVNQQIPILRVEDTTGIVGIDYDKNETVAACVMDNWTHNSVQCHFMCTNPIALRHDFLQTCFGYIFDEMGKKFIYGLVPGDNEKALKLNKHMGFTEKARLEDAFADGVDYVIMELKRENCKYLPVQEVA